MSHQSHKGGPFGELNIVQLDLDRLGKDSVPSDLSHQMQAFASATRALEETLARERAYSKQLREYIHQVTFKLSELQRSEASLKNQVMAQGEREETLKTRLTAVTQELEQTKAELARYRAAWSQVIEREGAAKAALSAGEAARKRLEQLEGEHRALHQEWLASQSQQEQAQRHLENYRAEVQALLVRLHGSEGRFSELSKEVQALDAQKKILQRDWEQRERQLRDELQSRHASELARALNMQVASHGEEVARLRRELQLADERATEAVQEFKDLNPRLLAAEAKAQSAMSRLETLQTENAQARAALAEQARVLERAQADLDQARAQERAQNCAIEGLHHTLTEQAQEAQAKLTEIQAKAEKAQAQAADAQARDQAKALAQAQAQDQKLRAQDQELQLRAGRISALQAEVAFLQDLLIDERSRYAELLPALNARLAELGGNISMDEAALQGFLGNEEVPLLASQKSDAPRPSLPPRFSN